MAELKTQENNASVDKFINSIADESVKRDCLTILNLMNEAAGVEPKMWGDSIIGYDRYHYKGKSGREGDWFIAGFSPRKKTLTIYMMSGYEQYGGLMEKLGKYTTGRSCLYIKKLDDIDLKVLKTLVKKSVKDFKKLLDKNNTWTAE